MNNFDIIVIGKGLIGTVAAKYLSCFNKKVAIIGPDESTDYDKSIVFSSHYDQARVQRLIGKDDVWTSLNVASAKQYGVIQQQSGINFHSPVGCLYVNPYGEDNYLKMATLVSDNFGLDCTLCPDEAALANACCDYSFPHTSSGLLEKSLAGFINPRLLVQAQLTILEQNSGVILKETVLDVLNKNEIFTVKTSEGKYYQASKILLTAGSFVNFFNLIPRKLDLKLKSEIVLLAKLSDEQAKELAHLPSLLYEINNEEIEGVYVIQPVKYPDGAYYLKMGSNLPEDIFFDNINQVQEWFRNGNSEQFITRLKRVLKTIMSKIEPMEYLTKRCIINRSVHGRPYIGETSQPGLYIASGCNGYSAMCSDAIGSLASQLMQTGSFPANYPANNFDIIYK